MNPNMPYDSNALKNMVSRVKVYCSHIIPLVFDNTLSYYESLCAFCAKVNELCDAVNAQNLTIAEFTHLVEVEITKFEEYIQTELNGVKDRLDTVEDNVRGIDRRLSDTERDLESLTETVRGINGRVGTLEINSESMQSDIAELQTIASTHTGQILILQNTMSALQNTVNSINTALSNKVDKSDVVDIVQENNMNPVTSNAVYETVTGGITPVIADATTTSKGVVQIGDNINVNNGIIDVPTATHNSKGVVKVGNNINLGNGGTINVSVASPDNVGLATIAGSGSNLTMGAGGIIDVPTADENTKGVVKVGGGQSHINISNTGQISVPNASTTTHGVVKIGENIDVVEDLTTNAGTISVPKATSQQLGVVKAIGGQTNINVNNDGVLNVPDASSITHGVVKIGENIDVVEDLTTNAGTISVPKATSQKLGVVKAIGGATNISVNNDGILNVPKASQITHGVVKIGDNINVTETLTDSTISVADASTSTKGVVQLTDTITDGDTTHVPTADAVYDAITGQTPPQIADATTSSKGIVQIGDNINVSSGEISVPDASTTTKGVVKYGNNFNINSNGQLAVNTGENITTDANGAIKVNTADTINKGVVSIGSNIEIANGAISVPLGGSTHPTTFQTLAGVVKPATNSTIQFDANGGITCNNALPATVNSSNYGTVKLVDTIASGDTSHVPTANAVYQAVQSAGLRYLLPVTRESWRGDGFDECFICSSYTTIVQENVFSANELIIGRTSFMSNANKTPYLFIRRNLIATADKTAPEIAASLDITITGANTSSYGTISGFSIIQIGNNDYFKAELAITSNSHLVTIRL